MGARKQNAAEEKRIRPWLCIVFVCPLLLLIGALTGCEHRSPADYAGHYTGRYVVDDEQATHWVGTADITVDEQGEVSGYVWLPTLGADGKPDTTDDGRPEGLVTSVTGDVTDLGKLTIKGDRVAAGTSDGNTGVPGVESFQFSYTGRVEEHGGRLTLTACGKGNQGFPERIVATTE